MSHFWWMELFSNMELKRERFLVKEQLPNMTEISRGLGEQLTLDEPLHLKSFLLVTNSIRIKQHMKRGASGAP